MTQPKQREMNFSLSAFQDWQACQRRYYYRHVRRLESTFKAPPLEKGIILHEFMAAFYDAVRAGRGPEDAYQIGMAKLEGHTQRLEIAAAAAYYGGDEELAEEIRVMPEALRNIATRYYRYRAYHDAQRYQVLVVEKHINVLLVPGVRSNSVVDLVTRDRETGLVYLWEHKTTDNMPSQGFRLRDLQTTLYAQVLRRYQVEVQAVLWNYLRTRVPAMPHQNKPTKANPIGALSKAKDVDTTWEVYSAEIARLGLDFEDYTDMYEKLKDREYTAYFPRYENQIVVDVETLLYDYAMEANNAKTARALWRANASIPTRTLTRSCDYCPFLKVCEAELMGGDPEEVIKLRFVEKGDNS